MKNKTNSLFLNEITLNKDFQPRDSLDGSHVNNLTETYSEGNELPPLTIWKDNNISFLLDGFHRFRAASNAQVESVPVTYFEGSRAEAMAYAFKVNSTHGLLLSRNERVKYLTRLLSIEPFKTMSEREAAKALGASKTFIHRLRSKNQGGPNGPVGLSKQQTSELEKLRTEISRLTKLVEQLTAENKALRENHSPEPTVPLQSSENETGPSGPISINKMIEGLSYTQKNDVLRKVSIHPEIRLDNNLTVQPEQRPVIEKIIKEIKNERE